MEATSSTGYQATAPGLGRRKPTREEWMAALSSLRESIGAERLATWDLDAEMEAEHRAVLAGADL